MKKHSPDTPHTGGLGKHTALSKKQTLACFRLGWGLASSLSGAVGEAQGLPGRAGTVLWTERVSTVRVQPRTVLGGGRLGGAWSCRMGCVLS